MNKRHRVRRKTAGTKISARNVDDAGPRNQTLSDANVEQADETIPERAKELVTAPQPERTKPSITTFERLGIPAVLVAAVYGAFSTVLDAYEKLNERRDLIMNIGRSPNQQVTAQQGGTMFFDYVFMWIGLCLFILIFAVVMYQVPTFVAHDADLLSDVKRLRWLCVALPVVGFLGFLAGGVIDVCAMLDYLRTPH